MFGKGVKFVYNSHSQEFAAAFYLDSVTADKSAQNFYIEYNQLQHTLISKVKGY